MRALHGLVLVVRRAIERQSDGTAARVVLVEVRRTRSSAMRLAAAVLMVGMLAGSVYLNLMLAQEMARLRKLRDAPFRLETGEGACAALPARRAAR